MKKLLFLFLITLIALSSAGQERSLSNTQLAVKYFNQKEFEKAAPLLKETYLLTKNPYYLNMYFSCLAELKDFETAEDEIKKEIRRSKNPDPAFYIQWGYFLKLQGKPDEAARKYAEALKNAGQNPVIFSNLANTFIQWREYEWAKNVYLSGREQIQPDLFKYELARIYYYLRDYENMMSEYLDYLRDDEKYLPRVESSISSVIANEFDDGFRSLFKSMVLKRIQAEPNLIAYNRLLIWFFIQEKNFSNALRQSIALDRRTGNEEAAIASLANIALNNREYGEAKNAYKYILEKGTGNSYYTTCYLLNLKASFLEFTREKPGDIAAGNALAEEFKSGLARFGYSVVSLEAIKDFANLLAFYLGRPAEAIDVLNNGLALNSLKPAETGELRACLGDVYLYSDDPWEATLVYSQVIETNKDNPLGDEVKFKKARMAYFTGNFDWAQAQLDVLKASTSKFTSNDAFELSLLISNNRDLDTTDVPLQMFARADFLFYKHQDSLAIAAVDSIETLYPYHSLGDDILFRKARYNVKNQNYSEAAQNLEQIVSDYAFDVLADDALFNLAALYRFKLKQPEKAQELYKKMLTDFPGSVYAVDARKQLRELRGDIPGEKSGQPLNDGQEELFFNGYDMKNF